MKTTTWMKKMIVCCAFAYDFVGYFCVLMMICSGWSTNLMAIRNRNDCDALMICVSESGRENDIDSFLSGWIVSERMNDGRSGKVISSGSATSFFLWIEVKRIYFKCSLLFLVFMVRCRWRNDSVTARNQQQMSIEQWIQHMLLLQIYFHHVNRISPQIIWTKNCFKVFTISAFVGFKKIF